MSKRQRGRKHRKVNRIPRPVGSGHPSEDHPGEGDQPVCGNPGTGRPSRSTRAAPGTSTETRAHSRTGTGARRRVGVRTRTRAHSRGGA